MASFIPNFAATVLRFLGLWLPMPSSIWRSSRSKWVFMDSPVLCICYFCVGVERFFYFGMPGPGTGSPPPPCGVMMSLVIVLVVLLNVFGSVLVCRAMVACIPMDRRTIAITRVQRQRFAFKVSPPSHFCNKNIQCVKKS